MHNNIAKGFLRFLSSTSCANSKRATIFTFFVNHSVYAVCFSIEVRDRSLFTSRGGGGEDFGLNKVKFRRSPLWMLLHWIIPPNKFWWFLRSPLPCLHFPSKFERSPHLILPKFLAIPQHLGSQLRLMPPFFLPKIKCSPPGNKYWPVLRRNSVLIFFFSVKYLMYVHIYSILLLLIFYGILSVTAAVSSNRNSILTILDVSRGVTHITHNI